MTLDQKYLDGLDQARSSLRFIYIPIILAMSSVRILKTHHLYYCAMFICLCVFNILNPQLSSIYDRLFLFVTPLISICICEFLGVTSDFNKKQL